MSEGCGPRTPARPGFLGLPTSALRGHSPWVPESRRLCPAAEFRVAPCASPRPHPLGPSPPSPCCLPSVRTPTLHSVSTRTKQAHQLLPVELSSQGYDRAPPARCPPARPGLQRSVFGHRLGPAHRRGWSGL